MAAIYTYITQRKNEYAIYEILRGYCVKYYGAQGETIVENSLERPARTVSGAHCIIIRAMLKGLL